MACWHNYTLMNANHEVLDFVYDNERGEVDIKAERDLRYAPLGAGNGGPTAAEPLGAPRVDRYALRQWLAHRYMPSLRPDARERLEAAGVSSTDQLMFSSLGLNLSDRFWFRPAGANIDWHDVNFFENGYVSDPTAALRTPDSSTPGALPKRWERIDGRDVLLKGSSSAEEREPYNELLATRLLRRLLGEGAFVPYGLTNRSGRVLSACATMASAEVEFASANEVVAYAGRGAGADLYRTYCDACRALGMANVQTELSKMLVCDYLMANFDRHLGNFGILRDAETHEGVCAAPLFDHGAAFFSRATTAELEVRRYVYVANPFSEYPSRQLAMVEDFSWYDPAALDGFTDEMRAALSENPHLESVFIEASVRQVERNIETVNDVAAERRRFSG